MLGWFTNIQLEILTENTGELRWRPFPKQSAQAELLNEPGARPEAPHRCLREKFSSNDPTENNY